MENYAATMPDATGNFHFQPGCSGFRQKAALIIFLEAMRRSADRRYNCQRTARSFGARLVSSRSMSANKRRLIIFAVHPIPTLRVETTRAPERRQGVAALRPPKLTKINSPSICIRSRRAVRKKWENRPCLALRPNRF